MEITLNPELKAKIYEAIRQAVTKPREGIHLSDLVFCTRKAYFRRMGMSPPPTEEQCTLWMTGYAFQAYMFPKDGEVTLIMDNIYCTPDVAKGIEVKSTRQSIRKFDPQEMHHWHRQILGYTKALNMLEYDLVVLFVCGNYAPPFPVIECWHIKATQPEVDANWLDMLIKRDKLEKALSIKNPPESDCMDWEWEYCENIDLCQDTQCWKKKQLKEMGVKKEKKK